MERNNQKRPKIKYPGQLGFLGLRLILFAVVVIILAVIVLKKVTG